MAGFCQSILFLPSGDYKPPLYIYAVVPSIWVFGLNEFAVRFPSAIAGTLLVIVTYFLIKDLFAIGITDDKLKLKI